MSAQRKLDFPRRVSDTSEADGTLYSWVTPMALGSCLISLVLEVVDNKTRLFRYLWYFG